MNHEITSKLESLSKHSVFLDTEDWVETKSVWARPIRPQSFKYANFENTNFDNIFNYSAFTLNRTLTALNEQDFLYMPDACENVLDELQVAYNPLLREDAFRLTGDLEKMTLGFLESKIEVGDNWNTDKFVAYFQEKLNAISGAPKSFEVIRSSKRKETLAQMLIIQHAVDFLPESSHMARFAKGDYGSVQSAFFRVMIDEYGYGKHESKHSTLFKELMKSVGLESNSHAYWMFYLNSSLLNNNYFHSITKKPERFFEYVGAITYAENTFGPYCKETAILLKDCFGGGGVDSRYYTEHAHIDGYHGSMTMDQILLPLIHQFGESIIPQFVKGIETSELIQQIMEDDFFAQVEWMDKREDYLQLARDIKAAVLADIENIPVAHLDEPRGELSVTHVHDGDEFCIVDEGVLRFCHGANCFSDLEPGECVVIRKNRLHGALVISENCKYRILSIDDYRKYYDRTI